MNYEDIKQIAAENGASVGDLIALAPNNDPFYIGRPNDWKQANWFGDLWRRFRYSTGVHLRRVHYQIISQSPAVLLPNRWSFTVTDAIYDGPTLAVPAGALLLGEQYAWKGPRLKDGKPIAGEAVRFLEADHATLPGQIRTNTTYYIAKVGEVRVAGQRYRWVQITDRREYSAAPMRLTPGTGGMLAEPYENTEKCWDYLTQAGKVARYLGVVRIDAFIDRRNPEPRIFTYAQAPEPRVDVDSREWDTPSLPDMPDLPAYSIGGYDGRQRYHQELWCEKSTMNDVLLPICERYGINLVTGLGEMSVTSVDTLLKRVKGESFQDNCIKRPVIIWYISDYDPAGQSMPVAVARKIEFMVRGDEENEPADIRLMPIVMTAAQVESYNLPRTPIKETEMRAAAFEARHGAGAVELDALEALYPGELARVIRNAVREFFDSDLWRKVGDARDELRDALAGLQGQVYAEHQDEIDQLTDEYEAIRRRFAAELEDWIERQKELWTTIAGDLEAQEYEQVLQSHPIPEADESDALLTLDPLFHSERSYGEQLRYYKEHQRKATADVDLSE